MPVLIPKHSMLRPHGTAHLSDPEGPQVIRDTVQCVHCGQHGVFMPGCGNKLGHCSKCMGPTCPSERCAPENCIGPQEKRLDLYESGKIDTL